MNYRRVLNGHVLLVGREQLLVYSSLEYFEVLLEFLAEFDSKNLLIKKYHFFLLDLPGEKMDVSFALYHIKTNN